MGRRRTPPFPESVAIAASTSCDVCPFNSMNTFIDDPISDANLAILLRRNSNSSTASARSDFNSMNDFIERSLSAADIHGHMTRPITVYSTTPLGGATNKKDMEIVVQAAAIANSVTQRTGYGRRLSLETSLRELLYVRILFSFKFIGFVVFEDLIGELLYIICASDITFCSRSFV